MKDKNFAFPSYSDRYEAGLTKREYFAGLFAAQMCAGEAAKMVATRDGRYNESNWKEIVAQNAVEFADALLKELDK